MENRSRSPSILSSEEQLAARKVIDILEQVSFSLQNLFKLLQATLPALQTESSSFSDSQQFFSNMNDKALYVMAKTIFSETIKFENTQKNLAISQLQLCLQSLFSTITSFSNMKKDALQVFCHSLKHFLQTIEKQYPVQEDKTVSVDSQQTHQDEVSSFSSSTSSTKSKINSFQSQHNPSCQIDSIPVNCVFIPLDQPFSFDSILFILEHTLAAFQADLD